MLSSLHIIVIRNATISLHNSSSTVVISFLLVFRFVFSLRLKTKKENESQTRQRLRTMASEASTSIEVKKENWFRRTFASKESKIDSSKSSIRLTSITNPNFVSFSDILRPKSPVDSSKSSSSPVHDPLVDITVNARPDVSSLVDKSKGTIDYFHTPPVSERRTCFTQHRHFFFSQL